MSHEEECRLSMERTTTEANNLYMWPPVPFEMREDGPPLPRSPLLNLAAMVFDGRTARGTNGPGLI